MTKHEIRVGETFKKEKVAGEENGWQVSRVPMSSTNTHSEFLHPGLANSNHILLPLANI